LFFGSEAVFHSAANLRKGSQTQAFGFGK